MFNTLIMFVCNSTFRGLYTCANVHHLHWGLKNNVGVPVCIFNVGVPVCIFNVGVPVCIFNDKTDVRVHFYYATNRSQKWDIQYLR